MYLLLCVAVCYRCVAVCWLIVQVEHISRLIYKCAIIHADANLLSITRVSHARDPCVAVCCSVLQRVAASCSELQRVAACCSVFHTIVLRVLQCVVV